MYFRIFYTVKVDTVYQNVLYNSYLFLLEFRKQINISAQVRLYCDLLKKNFYVTSFMLHLKIFLEY